MKRLLLFSLLVLIISFGCNNTTKKETRTLTISNTSENMYCYPIESPLIGQSYLSERFLNTIAEIELNPEKDSSLEGMVFINGGDFGSCRAGGFGSCSGAFTLVLGILKVPGVHIRLYFTQYIPIYTSKRASMHVYVMYEH